MPPPQDLRLPSLDSMRAFEAAARLGTLERAADELCISASAVGKRLAALEDLLGSPLLERGGKAMQLTATGREYLQQAGAALALLTAMPQHHVKQQRARHVRVTVPPTFARQVLVPALPAFTVAHPDVALEVVLSIPFLQGNGPDADVEVRNGDPADGMVLLHDRVLPLATPALLRQGPPVRVPSDLSRLTLLRSPLEPWTPWFRAAGLDWPEPSHGPKLVDLGMTLEAAACGQGIVLGRPSLARPWLAAGSLVPLFNIAAKSAQAYVLMPMAKPSGSPDANAAQAFADWLIDTCAAVDAEVQALMAAIFSDTNGTFFQPRT